MLLQRPNLKAGCTLDFDLLLLFLDILDLWVVSSRPIWKFRSLLGFFSLEVQADQKINVYDIIDFEELIETWSMVLVGYVVGLKTSFFLLSSFIKIIWGILAFDLHMLENNFLWASSTPNKICNISLNGFGLFEAIQWFHNVSSLMSS